MSVSLTAVREGLARHMRGELSPDETGALMRDARVLRRRMERLSALHPHLEVGFSAELEALCPGPALSASN
ncbi:MAG: hypothetical protein JKY65_22080 [Planctomycetes bacterium]|nr:hypothetical protein [Planctomycetota bacterium]